MNVGNLDLGENMLAPGGLGYIPWSDFKAYTKVKQQVRRPTEVDTSYQTDSPISPRESDTEIETWHNFPGRESGRVKFQPLG